jgi:hypothetical protein
MESASAVSTAELKKNSFIGYVFNFDEEAKADYLNAIQYSMLAFVLVVVLNKLVGVVIPALDEDKGSIEVLLEVLGQILLVVIGLMLINKIISYIPTYSQFPYKAMNITSVIMVLLTITLSLQTKLGEKTNLLIDRVMDAIGVRMGWGVQSASAKEKAAAAAAAQKQQQSLNTNPVVGGFRNPVSTVNPMAQHIAAPPQHQPSQADFSVPPSGAPQAMSGPDFNNMYQGPNISLPGANEPLAANDVLGGSFGSAF